jgi:hypothetical protein
MFHGSESRKCIFHISFITSLLKTNMVVMELAHTIQHRKPTKYKNIPHKFAGQWLLMLVHVSDT